MHLTVIIPTRDRRAVLQETLARLDGQQRDADFEVVVANDGSTDGTGDALRRQAAELSYPLRVVELAGVGPAGARNRALAEARSPVCLFIDDDTWPLPGLLRRHRDFHERHPEPEAGLLGHIDLAATPPPTPFMLWLAGIHTDFASIADPDDAGGDHFFTGNVSVKTAFIRSVGGYDESLTDGEDIDLGLRLEREGLRLVYDSTAAVEHSNPVDLPTTIARMRSVGRASALLAERHPGFPIPRRPGIRHRVKATVLTGLTAAGARSPRLQRETWRFLCHQATREAYWSGEEHRDRGRSSIGAGPRVGGTLARLASRHADARMPPLEPPWDHA